jgi:cell division protein FtsZ
VKIIYGEADYESLVGDLRIITEGLESLGSVTDVINLDVGDFNSVFGKVGSMCACAGSAEGAKAAAQIAIDKLRADLEPERCKGVIVRVTAPPDFSLQELDAATTIIAASLPEGVNMIFGTSIAGTPGGLTSVALLAGT